jgi:hypothetical protein
LLERRLFLCGHCGGFDLRGDQIANSIGVQFDGDDTEDGRKAAIIRQEVETDSSNGSCTKLYGWSISANLNISNTQPMFF